MADSTHRTRYCSRCLTTFIGELERCPNLGCGHKKPGSGWGELLEAGDLFDRHYTIERRLAIGGAGVTYLGRELDADGEAVGPHLAIKILYVQRDQGGFLRRLSNEAQILQELDHPGIVQLMGFVHRHGHSPYLLTRFEAGGSLLDLLRRRGALTLREAADIGVQICDALEVAHGRGVIHRDIKPENILLRHPDAVDGSYQICLTDFGIAKVSGGVGGRLTKVGTFVGTPQYAAPEQFRGLDPTAATDVYAVGAVLHFLVTLEPVVTESSEFSAEDQLRSLLEHLPPRIDKPDLDPDAVSLFNTVLASTMTADAGERGSIARVRELLDMLLNDQPRLLSSSTQVPDLAPAGELAPLVEVHPPTTDEADTFAGILSEDHTEDDEDAPATFDLEDPQDVASVNEPLPVELPPTEPMRRAPAEPPDDLDEGYEPHTPAPASSGAMGCVAKAAIGAAVLGVLALGSVGFLGKKVWDGFGGGPELVESGDNGYLQLSASVARQAVAFGSCDARGEVTLHLAFDAAGKVTSAQATGLPPAEGACVEGLASTFMLDWTGDEPAEVELVLDLE